MDYKHEEVKITSSPGQAPGTARIAFKGQPLASYAETTAGTLGTWTVEFTVGEGGIPEGGGIALWWPNQGFRFSVRQQGIYPERRGYATVETTGSARLDLRVNSRDPGHSLPLVVAQVREASLLDGDVVTFRFNDRSGGSPGGLTYLNVALGIRLHVGVDGDASGRFVEISGSPLAISVFADRGPRRYVALVPSTTSVGLSSTVQVVALDRCGNLAPGAAAQLGVESPNCGGLPKKFHLSYLDGGVKRLEKVSFPEGISRIRVIDRERGIEAVSNPVRCEPRPEFHVYWGDIHNHAYDRSLWLDLTPATDPDANYRYGRDVSRLDFCSLNFHLYLEHGYDGQEEAWKTVQECAARFHEPGKYVTFSGFEYHGMGGDRCMILNGDVVPRAELRDLYGGNTRRALESEGDIQRMFDFAAHTGSMVTCHVGGNPTDFSYHRPARSVVG